MSESVPSAAAQTRKLADALEADGLPYAVGGAIALGIWAVPRATIDVDLNVFVGATDVDRVVRCFTAAGCILDSEAARRAASDSGSLRATLGGMRVDIFLSSVPFHDSARARARTVEFMGRPIRVLSPEDLAIAKMLYYRAKDFVDLAQLIAVQGDRLDRMYVRKWLVEMVGETDDRIRRWEEIARG